MGFISSLVDAGARLIGMKTSADYAREEQKRQHKYNMEMAKWQNDANIANWNMQNEYNLPSNQMKRFKEAGLNPNLIYGSGTSTTAGTVPAASKPDSVTPINWSEIFHPMQNVGSILDSSLKAAQIEKTVQETSNLSSYQRNLNLEGDMKELEMIAQRYSNAKSKEEAEVWRDYWDNKIVGMRAQNELTDANRFNIDSQRKFRDEIETARGTAELGLVEYRRSLLQAQIADTLASVGVKNANINKAAYEISLLGEQINNARWDANLKQTTLKSKDLEYEFQKILKDNGLNLNGSDELSIIDRLIYKINKYRGVY